MTSRQSTKKKATDKKEETDQPQINWVKKLTTPKVFGPINARMVQDGESKELYSVVGVASGFKAGTSDYGPWTALTGTFAAMNLDTGENFRSGVAFLPDVALDPVVGQLNAGANAVEFGWVIGITGDDSVSVGYTYYARPLVDPSENDPLEELAAKLLPAPAG